MKKLLTRSMHPYKLGLWLSEVHMKISHREKSTPNSCTISI